MPHKASRLIALIVLSSSMATAHAGWHVRTKPKGTSPAVSILEYSRERFTGAPTVSAALHGLKHHPDTRNPDQIGLTGLLWSPAFQSELFTCLDRISPETLAAALRSSGDPRNPRMKAVARILPHAIRCTSTLRNVSSELAGFGLCIGDIHVEKVGFTRREHPRALLFSFGAPLTPARKTGKTSLACSPSGVVRSN